LIEQKSSIAVTIYVTEIGGRGIAAFNAASASAAADLVRDSVFRDDLMVLQSGGMPLCPAEDAGWQRSRAKALRNGDLDEAEPWVVFLVAIADPDRSRRRN